MELLEEMLANVLCSKIKLVLPDMEEIKELLELKCYKILREIKEIVDNEEYSDEDCFFRIEEIVCTFEKNGIYCDGRHDF